MTDFNLRYFTKWQEPDKGVGPNTQCRGCCFSSGINHKECLITDWRRGNRVNAKEKDCGGREIIFTADHPKAIVKLTKLRLGIKA